MIAVLIISVLLFLVYASLLIYYRQAWVAIPEFEASGTPSIKVSVIIPARNEEKNIGYCLDSILLQTYPSDLIEIIVIDDHSEDNTFNTVSAFGGRVRCIKMADHVGADLNSYKKKAIDIGIQISNGELIITTDADSIVPKTWLQTIISFYEKNDPEFIASPVLIDSGTRFIEKFQALDFMVLQGITGASVYKRFHSMCNGANLAYKRSAFYAVNGFDGIDNIASGDDMLLMHKIEQQFPERTMYLKSKNVIVETAPVHSLSEFFNQRIRWASKADKFGDKSLFPVLLVVYLFNLCLLFLPIICIFYNPSLSIIHCWLILIILKTIAELFFLYPVALFFDRTKMLWLFPIMQPFHIIYTVIAGWLGKFGSYKWKGRKVK
jgi:cellulose synthase/poly-beta-1,6-N-acetylglucosamine synthase-like glycosyltransferase